MTTKTKTEKQVAEEKKKHGRMRPNILGKKQGFMINESFGLEDDSS